MDEKSYADLVALCQFLPGPASSQVGIGIVVMRGGIMGGITAFIGFTMPSVIALIVFALLLQGLNIGDAGWIHGLKIVAVAVVAHAILGMAQKLTPDLQRKAIALAALTIALLWPTVFTQVGVILLAGVFGFLLYILTREPLREQIKSVPFFISFLFFYGENQEMDVRAASQSAHKTRSFLLQA